MLSVHSHLRLFMFQVLFQGKIVSREKIENNIYATFCGENKLH